MEAYYIGYIEIPPSVSQKLASKHGVTEDEVRDACNRQNRSRKLYWDEDPEHGGRLIVESQTSGGRSLITILHPVDISDGTWRLRTSIPDNS